MALQNPVGQDPDDGVASQADRIQALERRIADLAAWIAELADDVADQWEHQ